MNGHGTEVNTETGDSYFGEYKDDQRHGFGKEVKSTGEVYEGEWREGRKHGKGTTTFINGDIYQGMYVDGLRHGPGTFTRADGAVLEQDFVAGVCVTDLPTEGKKGKRAMKKLEKLMESTQHAGDETVKAGVIYEAAQAK